MSRNVAQLLMIVVLLALAQGRVSFAQMTEEQAAVERDLTALVLPAVPTSRNSGPLPITIEITSKREDLLTGRLRLEMQLGITQPFAWESDPLVVAPGKTTLQMMLPGIGQHSIDEAIPATLTLLTENERIDLSQHPVMVFSHGRRTLIVGVSEQFGRRASAELRDTLRLEKYVPDRLDDDITTFSDRREPIQMPRSVTPYMAYDLLVLVDEGFAYLEQSQLDAIAAWVRAGGGVLITPRGQLDDRHFAFLNTLAGELRYMPEADDTSALTGVAVATGDAASGIDLLRPGLGRAVVCHGVRPQDSPELLTSPQWREAVAHLWQLRHDQQQAFVQTGRWDQRRVVTQSDMNPLLLATTMRLIEQPAEDGAPPPPQAFDVDYKRLPLFVDSWATQQLMPRDAKFIPMWLIWVLLIALVIFIGPADYLLLTFFGARRWTWLTFPLVTVLFTIVLVQAARQSIGEATEVRSIALRDVTAEGEPLRETKLELWFAGGSVVETFELDRQTFVPMGSSTDADRAFGGGGAFRVQYDGSLLSDHTVTQRFSRWTPQLDRITRIGPPVEAERDAPAETDDVAESEIDADIGADAEPAVAQAVDAGSLIDWGALQSFTAVDASWLEVQADRRLKFRDALLSDRLPDAQVVVLRGRSALSVDAEGRILDLNQAMHVNPRWGYRGSPIVEGQLGVIASMAHVLTTRPDAGLFALLSRLSPTGGDSLEDLAMLDPSSPDECAVLIIVPEGDSFVVFRHLVRQGDT